MNASPTLLKWSSFLFAAFILALVVAADVGVLPDWIIRQTNASRYVDKLAHFFIMGGMSFLLCLTLAWDRPETLFRHLALGCGTVITATTLEECSQLLFPLRTFSWKDLVWSYAGIFCFALMAGVITGIWSRIRRRCQNPEIRCQRNL
ncbi:MAG: hypothetical protein CSA22_02970 [Deltaproteobacteria bacterium]|nr:MAG: hypothetical protein CSA22_02970 [Deltaproteobacteria bacterium]